VSVGSIVLLVDDAVSTPKAVSGNYVTKQLKDEIKFL
jgi:hypothetical protein